MGGKAHEHVQHAEHDSHHANDPFDRAVALTIAVVAAALAAITLLGHRAHNETLQKHIEAGRLKTEENDQWSFYQAKNIRQHMYEALAAHLESSAVAPGKEETAKKQKESWRSKAEKYDKTDLPEIKAKAEKLHHDSLQRTEESHAIHVYALRYDLGQLFVQLGLVLCSVAVLTKRKTFWMGGTVISVAGILIAASVLVFPPEAHHDAHTTPDTPGHSAPSGSGNHGSSTH